MSNRRTKKKKYRGGKIPMVDDELYVFSKYNVIYRGNIINNYDTNNLSIICGSGNHSKCNDGSLDRYDHYRDWDLCMISNKKNIYSFILREFKSG